jgi:hypothetical protein
VPGQHRTPRQWFRRAERGRNGQPQPGRHTYEYHYSVDTGVGMHPVGGARRVTLAEHLGDNAQDISTDDRGDRFSHTPSKG